MHEHLLAAARSLHATHPSATRCRGTGGLESCAGSRETDGEPETQVRGFDAVVVCSLETALRGQQLFAVSRAVAACGVDELVRPFTRTTSRGDDGFVPPVTASLLLLRRRGEQLQKRLLELQPDRNRVCFLAVFVLVWPHKVCVPRIA